MNELSLFSGVGGGILGTKHLLGWRTVGYVEWEDYPQRVLAQRIKDGYLDEAPIFGDIRSFISEGYARRYRGMVDVITAGFPCQPFSKAGKQIGEDDPRNMWPQTIDAIRIIKPEYVFLENVPGLISSGYIITVINNLRAAGYQTLPPLRLSASDVGANHQRERVWIAAYTNTNDGGHIHEQTKEYPSERRINAQRELDQVSWWRSEPDVLRVVDGMASELDKHRLKAIGNGQVPGVAAKAWELLTCAA